MTPCLEKVVTAIDHYEETTKRYAHQIVLHPIWTIRLARELQSDGVTPWADDLEKAIVETGYPPKVTLFQVPLATNWRVPFGEVEVL